ncbi:MAG: redoxin domain-containing protein [Ferruginibacter sp.]
MVHTVPTVPTDLTLNTPEGTAVPVGDLVSGHLLVVQLVRYFGCLPCQDWLVDLDQASTTLAEHGVTVAAVGGSTGYQARWLRDERGVTMPLYLDVDHLFRKAMAADEPLGHRLLDPRGAVAYARSLTHGFRPQTITRDAVRSPGVVILDQRLDIRWQHLGTRIGDYPPLQDVERVALQLAMENDPSPTPTHAAPGRAGGTDPLAERTTR